MSIREGLIRHLLKQMPSPPQSVAELDRCAYLARRILKLMGLEPPKTG